MMRLTRREAMLVGAVGVAAGALSGCSRLVQHTLPARDQPETTTLPATGDLSATVRLLNRAAFGPIPGDVVKVEKMGVEAWLNEQLNAPTDDSLEAPGLQLRLATIDAIHADGWELRDIQEDEVIRQLQQATILRAVYSPWQLRERMVDFWTNHLNIYSRKLESFSAPYKAVDDTVVIRNHALGSFPEMLKASARSPAMLSYLDNQKNKKGVANENYAREIMELHTLGVDGGYTQKDVQEVARCLTGWTIEDRPFQPRGNFRFDESLHDNGAKLVLGHRIPPGGGVRDGEMVLEILAKHPSTARFISRKMVRYFYGEEDAALVAETAKIYLKTDGDIKAMVKHLMTTPRLQTAPPTMKRPFDFIVSTLRATDANTDGHKNIQDYLDKMGQPLFQWPMPDGYPDKTVAWTGSLLTRWNFVIALLQGEVQETSIPDVKKADKDALLEQVFARRKDDPALANLRAAIAVHTPLEALGLMLVSPAFQWR